MFSAALYARVQLLCTIRTRDRGCSAHPAFPAPSELGGEDFKQDSDAMRRENANSHPEWVRRYSTIPVILRCERSEPRRMGCKHRGCHPSRLAEDAGTRG